MGSRVAVLAISLAFAFAAFSNAQQAGFSASPHAQQTPTEDPTRLKEAMDRAERGASIEANKATFVSELLARWADDAAARGYDAYSSKGTRKLMARSGEDLLRLSQQATDFDTFRKLVFDGYSPNFLGQATADLVFTPMAACRLYDSRFATAPGLNGPMAPGTQRSISVSTGTVAQGGSNPACGSLVPDLANDPPALALTLTAVGPTGPGNLRTFASGAAVPLAAMLTYTTGTTISTGVITSSCTACGTELTIRNQGAGNADVIVDIVGYFNAPFTTSLEVQSVVSPYYACPSSFDCGVYQNCNAGYTITGGGCQLQFYNFYWFWANNSPLGATNGWNCQGTNTSGSSQNMRAVAMCSRVPGR
jgi:hypothetical protein